MSYCLNPDCQKPQNSPQAKFCQTCGSQLLLKDRYRAVMPIGEGGFGRTFVAIDEHRLQTRCVIKQFVPQAQGSSAAKQSSLDKSIQLFNQEAVRLDELGEHAQIPTLLAYFEQESRLYLIQQFIQGQNLNHELHMEGTFDETKIRQLLADLLPVLQFIHERQVIHRDIKPGNIVRCRNTNKLVLIDFGVAKQITAAPGNRPGTRIGTEGYAPVEQWRSGKAYPASDLYSLGATCLNLMTRVKPDSLFDPVDGRWLWQEHLANRGITLTPQLERILNRLLKDAVVERYQSAAEVLRDLQAPSGQFPLEARPKVLSPDEFTTIQFPVRRWKSGRVLSGHKDRVRSIAISPDSQLLASSSNDKTIQVWDLATGNLLHSCQGHTGPVHSVAIHSGGQVLVSGSNDKTIRFWQLSTGRLLYTLTGHTHWVNAIAIVHRGKTLVSGSEDKSLKIWELRTGSLLQTLTGHTGPIHTVAIAPDGQTLVSGSSDRTIKLWNLRSGELLQTLTRHSSRVNTVAISANGQILASGSDDCTIKLWNLATGQLLHTLTDHTDAISSLAISADGQMLISGSHDTKIKLWELPTGKLLSTLSGHSWWVNAVAISPDGGAIASGSTDKLIQLWQAET